jgi:hypothetical protein
MSFPRKPWRIVIAVAAGVCLATGLAGSGCRAFQPEPAVINKPPETFITGAPSVDGGGYYLFHVYWYGRDVDGRVERFVWALTDGSLQDPDTNDDEEDQRFNPALNANTLDIGRWTTRTDSIFAFTINNGENPSAELTLHMVARDDRGAFDRTPARLHFFANSLGNPTLRFFRVSGDDTVAMTPGVPDTVGYGHPYRLMWRSRSPNVRGYSPAALALIDTSGPADDGVLGYKWKVDGALGGNCNPSQEDCWHPRRFNEASNDSFSFFGPDSSLYFSNDDARADVFGRRLPSGTVQLEVDAIDIAGVEVAESRRRFDFVVNYDPQTLLLDGERDWAHPSDPETYPYYIRMNDPAQTHHPFRSGERIPDRTYVVVKALARDDARDRQFNPDFRIALTGYLRGARRNYSGGVFNFVSENSSINTHPAWDAGVGGWYGDTLGFLTAPATRFTVGMFSIDELDRRDGTPAELAFDVGFPPCLQCIELLPKPATQASAFDRDVPCVLDPNDLASHPCLAGTTDMLVTYAGAGANELGFTRTTTILVNKGTGFLRFTDSPTNADLGINYAMPGRLYKLGLLLHGEDDSREAWAEPVSRIGGWRYEVHNDCDPYNAILDGGGTDDINLTTWGPPKAQTINTTTGVWKLEVDVAVPTILVQQGPELFRAYVSAALAAGDPSVTEMIYRSVTQQFGDGWVDAVAVDQTICGQNPDRPARYNFFRNVRPAVGVPAGVSWRDCGLDGYVGNQIKDRLPLSLGAMPSLEGQPVRKRFSLTLVTPTGEIGCWQPQGAEPASR